MNIDEQYGENKYLKAEELDEDMVVTIRGVKVETLGQGKDAEEKPVVYFKELPKGLALNKTNATTIKTLYGPETDDWKGQKITLWATEVDFQGKMVPAIRVRSRAPSSKPKPKPQPAPVAAEQDDDDQDIPF
jgi:hypothetical protein